jgi:PAS domain S-box-containing protein
MTKILIIEDNSVLLDSISDFLAEEGFDILKALNGEEGVEMALRNQPDIILSDIYMPKMNGYQVFDALRKAPSTSLIPFIFISAKAEKEDILYGLKMGADDYIIKPIDFPELLKRILTRIEKTHNTMQLSEVKYQALFESANDAILMVRAADNSIMDANPTACAMLGFEKDQLLEFKAPDLFVPLAGNEPLPFYSAEHGWGAHFLSEAKWILSDKKQLPIQVSGRKIHLVGEDFIFLIARDISLQKEHQQQLILAKEKAEESDRLKSSILANMSHELRTPLNGILGFAEILKEELVAHDLVIMAENIRNSGKWLLNTLDSILTLSQLEAGKIMPKPVITNIVVPILDVVQSFQSLAEEKSIYIKAILPESLMFLTDERLIRHIVLHLVDNAIKFTKTGGITVEAALSAKDTNELIISISDTGIGIPAENLEMIFQEFRQVSEGIGRQFQGSGIGLSISHKIIDLLGGAITLESEPGKGSCFRVRIPGDPSLYKKLGKPEAIVISGVLEDTPAFNTLPHVLLVEDNLLNRELTAYFLKNICTLDQTARGEEAIQMAGTRRYSAILMDINLGQGMDGLKVTQSIRKLPGYLDTPVIALTGYSYEDEIEKLLVNGCTHYITKPYDKATLISILNRALGRL